MRKYEDSVSSATTGLPVYLAEIRVQNADTTAASLYSDNGVTPLTQPVLTDGLGLFNFYVADGTYTIVVADPGGANPRAFTNVEIYEDARNVSVPIGEAGVTFPSVGARAGNLLAFDGGGLPIAVPAYSGDPVAAVVAEAITRASADAALGSRVTATEANIAPFVGAIALHRVEKLVDTSVTSSTTLISDPDLSVPLAASALVNLRGHIIYSASAAGDLKWQHAGPTATTIYVNRSALAPGDTTMSGIAIDSTYSAGDIVVPGGAGLGMVEFEAIIQNGVTPGNFAFKFAQNTSDATATIVKAGSYIDYKAAPALLSFSFASTAIAKLGGFSAPTPSGGHNVIIAVGPTAIAHSYIETIVTGSSCQAQLNAGNYELQVDGVVTTITAPAGWTYVSLFVPGFADAPHRVRLTGVAYDSDIALRVTGAAPAIARPSDIPNFYPLTLAPYNGYVARDAPGLVSSPNAYPTTETTWLTGNGFGFRFGATTTSVRIWYYDGAAASTVVLLQDGAVIATIVPPGTTGVYNILTLATGLSGAHNYEIIFISSQKSAFGYAVLVDTLTASTPAARASDAYYGDSIVAMSASPTLADARVGDSYILAHSLGRAAVRVGVGGTGVSVDASGNLAVKYGRDNTAGITGLPVPPTRVFVCYGVNDVYYGVSTATFQADYQTMLAAIRTGLPSAKIYCRGILPNTRSPLATPGLTPTQVATLVATYNTAMQAAVTAIADANIVYVSTLGWIDPVNPSTDTLDGLHPAVGGYAKIAAAQALVL